MAGNAAQRPIRKREFGQSDPRVPPQVRASVTSTKPCGMFAVAWLCRSVNNSTQLNSSWCVLETAVSSQPACFSYVC